MTERGETRNPSKRKVIFQTKMQV